MKMLIGFQDTSDNQPALQFARLIAGHLGAEVTVPQRVSTTGILQAGTDGDYDLVAIRWTGDSPWRDKTARRIIANVAASVLVIKGQPEKLERLLVCSGGRPIAEPVIKMAASLAVAAGAKATLLHVVSPVPSMYTGLDAMEEGLQEFLERDTPGSQHLRQGAEVFARQGIEAVLELRHGVAEDEILRATQLRHYDLIVVGATDAAGRLNRLFVGEVTNKVVERALAPVLVVRG